MITHKPNSKPTLTTIELARVKGQESALAYHSEFGETVSESGPSIGDWDSTAWDEEWKALTRMGASKPEYEAALAAWREGFGLHD